MRLPVRKHRDGELEPFRDLWELQRETRKWFDDFFRGWGFDLAPIRAVQEGTSAYTPTVDVVENDREVRISAELPGIDEKDVEVSLSGDLLTIRGEKRTEEEEESKNVYRMERTYGAFHRAIPIPAEVDQDNVEASFKKGVLTITLPKTAEAKHQAKRIAVKSE